MSRKCCVSRFGELRTRNTFFAKLLQIQKFQEKQKAGDTSQEGGDAPLSCALVRTYGVAIPFLSAAGRTRAHFVKRCARQFRCIFVGMNIAHTACRTRAKLPRAARGGRRASVVEEVTNITARGLSSSPRVDAPRPMRGRGTARHKTQPCCPPRVRRQVLSRHVPALAFRQG